MLIREADLGDWDYISAISRKAGYSDYINQIGDYYLREGTVIVAELGGKVVGFAKLESCPDGSTWLGGLRVDPSYREMGIGSALSERLIKLSRNTGARYSRLIIEHSNVKSMNIAEKTGFRKVGSYRFFRGGIDLSGYENYEETGTMYVDIGWVYVRDGLVAKRSGKFYHKDGNRLFFNEERDTYHILSLAKPVLTREEGITTVSEGITIKGLLPLRPLEDFSKAFLFEIDLSNLKK